MKLDEMNINNIHRRSSSSIDPLRHHTTFQNELEQNVITPPGEFTEVFSWGSDRFG